MRLTLTGKARPAKVKIRFCVRSRPNYLRTGDSSDGQEVATGSLDQRLNFRSEFFCVSIQITDVDFREAPASSGNKAESRFKTVQEARIRLTRRITCRSERPRRSTAYNCPEHQNTESVGGMRPCRPGRRRHIGRQRKLSALRRREQARKIQVARKSWRIGLHRSRAFPDEHTETTACRSGGGDAAESDCYRPAVRTGLQPALLRQRPGCASWLAFAKADQADWVRIRAKKALELDEEDSWGHVALGYATLQLANQPVDAIDVLRGALRLNSNLAIAHYFIALASTYAGDPGNAFCHADMAERLQEHDLLARGNAGAHDNVRATASFVAGRYREGIAYRQLVTNCALAGEVGQAANALRRVNQFAPDVRRWIQESERSWGRADDYKRYLEGFRMAGFK